MVNDKVLESKDGLYSTMISLDTYDCYRSMVSQVSISGYSETGSLVLPLSQRSDSEWKQVPPGSRGEALVDRI